MTLKLCKSCSAVYAAWGTLLVLAVLLLSAPAVWGLGRPAALHAQASPQQVTTIGIGEVMGAVYDSSNGYLYVGAEGSSSSGAFTFLYLVSTATNSIVSTFHLSDDRISPRLYDPSKGYIYAWDEDKLQVVAISDSSNSIVATFLGYKASSTMAYDSSNGYLYVVGTGGGPIYVVSDRTNAVVGTIYGVGSADIIIDSRRGLIFVDGMLPDGSGEVDVVSDTTNAVIARIPVVAPGTLLCDSSKGFIYLISGYGITVISEDTNTVLRQVPLNFSADTAAHDSADDDYYIPNPDDSLIHVYSGTTFDLRGTISVGYGPWYVIYVPSNGYIYSFNQNNISCVFVDSIVAQPMTISLAEQGAPQAAFALSGCGTSSSTIPDDGVQHLLTGYSWCTITVTAPPDNSNTRYRFTGNTTSSSVTTCSNGVCSAVSFGTYYQTLNTFQITAKGQSYFDIGLGANLTAQFLGVPASVGNFYTWITMNSSYSLQAWTDYGPFINFSPNMTGAASLTRWAVNPSQQGPITLGGDLFNADYYKQVSESFSYSLIGGGSPIAPTLNGSEFGSTITLGTLGLHPSAWWLDYGSSWSTVSLLSSSNSLERWITTNDVSGDATAGSSVSIFYYHQYFITTSYSVVGTVPASSTPILSYVSFNTTLTAQLGTSPSSAWMDADTYWTVPAMLQGSTSTERWATGSTANLVSSSGSYNVPYFHQFSLTVSYSIADGGSPGGPLVSYVSYGEASTASATSVGSQLWPDDGSSYSIAATIGGSSQTERWQANGVTPGMMAAPLSVQVVYYHQFLQTLSYLVMGGGQGYGVPAASGYQFGSPYAAVLSASPTGYWFDASGTVQFTNPLPGSNSGERWESQATAAGTGSASSTTLRYYHQFALTLSYSVSDGSTPAPPALTSTAFGTTYLQNLALTPNTYWLDSGATWTLVNPLSGFTLSERWSTSQNDSGIVSGPTTATFQYYHQFVISVGYVVMDGGNPIFPMLSGTAFGASTASPIATTPSLNWLDAGTSFSISNPLQGSGSSERWYMNSSSSGSVKAPLSTTLVYYHQFALTLSYSVSDGSTPAPPALTSTAFGTTYLQNLALTPNTYWLDSGATWTLVNPLSAGEVGERWITATSSGVVSSAFALSLQYTHQFYVTLSSSPPQGGTVSESIWVNSADSLDISAQATPRWQFEGWNGSGAGSYSGSGLSHSITVSSPISEVASFYPGVSINEQSGGSVAYSYEGGSGVVGPGASTIFVPLGSSVRFTASPWPLVFQFGGYLGSVNASSASAVLIVNAPAAIAVKFNPNWSGIAMVASLIVLMAAFALFWYSRAVGRASRKGGGVAEPGQSAREGPTGVVRYCANCGSLMPAEAAICPVCGASQPTS